MALYREPIPHPSEVVDLETDVRGAILERLYNDQSLRQSKASIDVEVVGGVARLMGLVRTDTHIDMATAIARRTAGVREVRNELVSDSQIERQTSMMLALDPSTRLTTDQITVASLLGSLMLLGKVESEEKKAAALTLIETIPGVVEIVDALEVSALAGRRVSTAAGGEAAPTAAPAAAGEHGAAAPFVLEWPRKTKKGKVASPLSPAARAKAGR